ncbi:PrsW family intramembrane metalloprotease [Sneathiella sp.]|uniref:PrsW family intramembrane metalloprotease n=1 Tax=Sneathiella sp. TaxID=1964365 RepID=UPI0035672DB8
MAKKKKPVMPTVPRDHDEASFSELVPFRSKNIKIFKSPLFLLTILLAIGVPFLFAAMGGVLGNPDSQQRFGALVTVNLIVCFFMVMMFQLMIFFYSRTSRPIWTYMYPFAAVCVIMMTPLITPYFFVFRTILPGNIGSGPNANFIMTFIGMFFGAGLMEELLKATPILFGAWWAMKAETQPSLKNNMFWKIIHVRGPLDGALMGIFAGGAFTFIETGTQYVPNMVQDIAKETGDLSLGMAGGLLLLMPRVLGSLVGHMAYAGIVGYFVGLAVIRPKQMWKILAIGWLSGATIHALWNSVPIISPILSYVIAGVSAVGLVAAILKARHIDAKDSGRTAESFGSIVVGSDDKPPQRAAAAPTPPPAAQAAPAAAAPPPSAATAKSEMLALDIDGLQIPLRADSTIDLGGEPALGGRGAGVTGAVVPHPSRANVIGLRNSGSSAWSATLRDGSKQMIEVNQNIRLAPGVVINFGGDLVGTVVGQG